MNNTLLSASLLIAAAYVVVGPFIPVPILSICVSVFLLIVGATALWRYGGPAFDVVVRGERGEDPGAHLAVYGMALIAAGSVYSGAYGIVWNVFDQPAQWVASWYSAGGRALTAAGFVLMVRAPDAVRARMSVPGIAWLLAIMAVAVVVAFLVGTQVS